MERFSLLKNELIVLIVNCQAALSNDNTCYCDTSDICFTCETTKLLKRVSKQTGMPIALDRTRPRAKARSQVSTTEEQAALLP